MPFQRPALSALSFPGEAARESWTCGADGVWKRGEFAAGGVMGVETIAFDSAPFWSLNLADSPAEAVALRWEGFGLTNAGGAQLWAHWPVTRKGKQVLVATLALAAEAAGPDWENSRAAGFEPSARMLPLPDNGLVVWQELGRQVVAFTREAQLLHVTVLTSRRLDADAAFELRDLAAALQTHGFIDAIAAIHVWTRCETDFAPQLACLFEEADVIKEPRPDPRLPAAASGLLPAQVAALRQQQRLKQRQLLLLATAALVYLCFFGAWWLRLQWRESRLNQTDLQMAATQPEIDLVREAQGHWLEMEGAINPDLYPVELFHQIVSLLPNEGIRLKEFQIADGRLIVSGEATTVNHALGFKDRLVACEPLQRYHWNFPVPAIREDNRAEFRAEGTLSGGSAHEGQ
ncbi:MAG: hypothetical protein ACKVY0_05125 [Prosthecobacter sp.]|uniref:hypothetical protein n=1 Tax=Prosthecobacter sp. TaxID=1965333 RepID=UPI0038FF3678